MFKYIVRKYKFLVKEHLIYVHTLCITIFENFMYRTKIYLFVKKFFRVFGFYYYLLQQFRVFYV